MMRPAIRYQFCLLIACCFLLGQSQCSILTDTGQWDTQAARTQRQDASGSAASPVSANNGDESAANSPGTEGSADKIVPLLDIGLSTIHSAVEQLFDIGSASDTSDTASAEVEHAIEAPPFSSDDADAGDVIAINDVGIENAAAAVAVEPSAELPNAAGGILASAGGEGAFVLLDAVSTNSGINGFPELAVTHSLVSLVDRPGSSEILLDSSGSDGTAADKRTNATTKPSAGDDRPAESGSADVIAADGQEAASIDESFSAAALVDAINDSGGILPPDLSAESAATAAAIPATASGEVDSISSPNAAADETQIPLFSEWAQKRMEEVEKEQEQDAANTSLQKKNHTTGTGKVSTAAAFKLRTKNYASPDCGAKIVASNSESSNTRAVLTLTKDEYLLSPCTSRIWFVVELCEAIQAEMIDLANFELFSSSPRNFSVAVANRFPTRDWSQVGRFTALDERDIQTFDLHPHLFGKYVRVDIHSHYNSEHFCPISLFRVFGTSEFEAFETENRLAADEDDDDDDDEHGGVSETNALKRTGNGNIFQSASDAVMSIVKAAATFVKPQENRTDRSGGSSAAIATRVSGHGDDAACVNPVHMVQCLHCSTNFTAAVAELVACKQHVLRRMLAAEFVYQALVRSRICAGLVGVNVSGSKSLCDGGAELELEQPVSEWIVRLLPDRYVAALCNLMASDGLLIGTTNTSVRSQQAGVNVTIDRKDNSIKATATAQRERVAVVEPEATVILEEPTDDSKEKIDTIVVQPPSPVHSEPKIPIENNPIENNDEITNQIPAPPVEITDSKSSAEKPEDKNNDNYVYEADLHDKDSIETLTISQPVPPISDTSAESTASASFVENLAEMPVNSIVEMASELLNADDEIAATMSTTMAPHLASEDLTAGPDDSIAAVSTNGGANGSGGQKVQSESVFLRLSNRVKSLERNMSLSGQYLEELSRRYKKQVEELQVAFSKTLLIVEEQSKRSADREQQLCAQNDRLRDDVDRLHERLGSWHQHVAYAVSMLCVQFVWWLLRKLCTRSARHASELNDADAIPANLSTSNQSRSARLRRKSTDAIAGGGGVGGKAGTGAVSGASGDGHPVTGAGAANGSSLAKRRRPSEEALHIGGTYAELMIDDDEAAIGADAEEYDHFADPTSAGGDVLTARQQRKMRRAVKRTKSLDQSSLLAQRHNGGHHRTQHDRLDSSGSCDNLSVTGSDADASSTAGSEPVLDENYEVYVPGSDMVYNEFMPDGPSGRSTPVGDAAIAVGDASPEQMHLNGGIAPASSASIGGASLGGKKSEKLRRLSSPAFLKSPFSRPSSMSLGKAGKVSKKATAKSASSAGGGQHEQTTGWEWYRRKDTAATAAAIAAAAATETQSETTFNSSQGSRNSASNQKSKSKSASPSRTPPPSAAASSSPSNGERSASATALSSNNTSSRSSVEKKQGSFRRMLKKVF